jgi:hypothetical protein
MDLVLLPQVLFILKGSVFCPPRPFNPLPLSHSSGHSSTDNSLTGIPPHLAGMGTRLAVFISSPRRIMGANCGRLQLAFLNQESLYEGRAAVHNV